VCDHDAIGGIVFNEVVSLLGICQVHDPIKGNEHYQTVMFG
jgi:hypothetical protein